MKIQKQDNLDIDEWKSILETFPEHRIYHTPEWFKFLMNTQKAKLRVYLFGKDEQIIGFLPGLVMNKGPIRIFASPFEGWYTPYLGPLLRDDDDIYEVLKLLKKQFKKDFIHFAQITPVFSCDIDKVKQNGFKTETSLTYITDIKATPEDVLRSFSRTTKYNIRKSFKTGLVARFTKDRKFIETFYEQLEQVFLKSNMAPTYSKEKVKKLWDTLMPLDVLYATEVVYNEKVIATRLEVLYNDWVYAHGSASNQNYLDHKPNEFARYHIMSYAADNGYKHYDMMGGGAYKAQFGGVPTQFSRIIYDPLGLLKFKKIAKSFIRKSFKLRR